MQTGAETWAQAATFEPANFKSKAAIKRALEEDPTKVSFIEIGTVANGFIDTRRTAAELLAELDGTSKYVLVVGPDPYRLRNYFGQISAKGGKLVIK